MNLAILLSIIMLQNHAIIRKIRLQKLSLLGRMNLISGPASASKHGKILIIKKMMGGNPLPPPQIALFWSENVKKVVHFVVGFDYWGAGGEIWRLFCRNVRRKISVHVNGEIYLHRYFLTQLITNWQNWLWTCMDRHNLLWTARYLYHLRNW